MINPALILYLTPILVLITFATMRSRTAVVACYLGAWLFLPIAGLSIPGLPDYTKVTATNLGIIAGVLIFDTNRILRFKPNLYDVPILVWVVAPGIASISNNLGAYDALSGVVGQVLFWVIPYLIGRIYFNDRAGLMVLAKGIVIGGLLYVPLCLIEVRISPQFHRIVYGYQQHSFGQAKRWGGFRPVVFMQHGLEVGMWMTSSSLIAFWCWRARAWRSIGVFSAAATVTLLIVTAVLCKSTGALGLLAIGIAARVAVDTSRPIARLMIFSILLIAPAYLAFRLTGVVSTDSAISLLPSALSPDRISSLKFRLDNEDILMERAFDRPWFGWGGWGRSRVFDDKGRDVSITDGLWIIALGQRGLLGLMGLAAMFTWPCLRLVRKLRDRDWRSAEVAPVFGLAMVVTLHFVDCLLNAHLNPIYILAVGGLTGLRSINPSPEADPRVEELADLGHRLRLAGRPSEASQAWAVALDRLGEPNRLDVEGRELASDLRNDQAWLHCFDPEAELHNPLAAARLAAEALAINPAHHSACNTLALALYRLGDLEAAIRALPPPGHLSDPFDLVVAALVYRSSGSSALADEHLAQLILPAEPSTDLISLFEEARTIPDFAG